MEDIVDGELFCPLRQISWRNSSPSHSALQWQARISWCLGPTYGSSV